MELEVLSYENGKLVPGEFTFCVPDAWAAIETYVLAQESWVGAYTLDPDVEA